MIELTIADLIFNRVLCAHPAKVELVLSVLSRRLNITEASGLAIDRSLAHDPDADVQAGPAGASSGGSQRWVDLGHGVAMLPISGSLVARTRGLDAMSGLQSYKQIGADFSALMVDDSVRHIVLNMDSPGGSFSTLPDLVDQVAAARGVKPVTALVDDSAYSAGYWIASAAQEVIASRTSGVGSIGAMAVHVDRSKANESAGIKVTAVTSGARKNMLASDRPLSDDDLAFLESQVEAAGSMFIESAAQLRGLSAKVVRAMEAGIYTGAAAVDVGLVDKIMSASDALREIVGRYQPGAPEARSGGRVQRAARSMAVRSGA